MHGFSVVTRVSRNGSALSSHVVRVYNNLSSHRVRTRILSSVSLRHRHNVAVGTRDIALSCGTSSNRACRLGFVSAPNRMSFSCRISHSLTTYRNTLLIISTKRNIRTRALTGYCATVRVSLRIIPMLGGVSLPTTSPRHITRRVRSVINVSTASTIHYSTGANINIRSILRHLIHSVPPPRNSPRNPLRTLVVSS